MSHLDTTIEKTEDEWDMLTWGTGRGPMTENNFWLNAVDAKIRTL